MCVRFSTIDKVIIYQIEGCVGGGGSELSAAFDMRGKTRINQMEAPLGIPPARTCNASWKSGVGPVMASCA